MLTQNSISNQTAFENIFYKINFELAPIINENWSWAYYSKLRVPYIKGHIFAGRGRPNLTCGKFYHQQEKVGKIYSCQCKHRSKIILPSCYKIACPICFQKGILRTSQEQFSRWKAIRKRELYRGRKLKLRHFSFNIKTRITSDNYVLERRKIAKIIKKYNGSGILIYHPCRKNYRGKKLVSWTTRPALLKEVYQKTVSMRESAHFHFIGVIELPHFKVFEGIHGFQYTNITYKNGRKNESLKGVRRLTRYLLSHTAKVGNFSTITWYGDFSYNKTKNIKKEIVETIPECQHCKSLLYLILDDPLKIKGNYMKGLTFTLKSKFELDRDSFLIVKTKVYIFDPSHEN